MIIGFGFARALKVPSYSEVITRFKSSAEEQRGKEETKSGQGRENPNISV